MVMERDRFLWLGLVLSLALSLGLPVQAEDYGDHAIGRDLARDLCAECHGVEPDDMLSPNDMAPLFREVAAQTSTTRMSLTVWMGSTHPTMPSIKLSAEDTDHVISYILNLRETAGN